jgi:hypothetical protein
MNRREMGGKNTEIIETRKGKQFTWSVKILRGDKSYNGDEYKVEGVTDTFEQMQAEMERARTMIRIRLLDGI